MLAYRSMGACRWLGARRIRCNDIEQEVIERILRHLELWEEEVRVCSGTDPPPEPIVEPWFDDPCPDCDTEPVTVSATWA